MREVVLKSGISVPAVGQGTWAIRDGNTIAIPKSSSEKHTVENAQAADIVLTDEELAMLDKAFPAPDRETPLDVE